MAKPKRVGARKKKAKRTGRGGWQRIGDHQGMPLYEIDANDFMDPGAPEPPFAFALVGDDHIEVPVANKDVWETFKTFSQAVAGVIEDEAERENFALYQEQRERSRDAIEAIVELLRDCSEKSEEILGEAVEAFSPFWHPEGHQPEIVRDLAMKAKARRRAKAKAKRGS